MTNTRWSFRDTRGRFRACRLSDVNVAAMEDDPMTAAYGVDTSEFYNDWRKRDLRDGCPRCQMDVLENASEPDVLRRWELR